MLSWLELLEEEPFSSLEDVLVFVPPLDVTSDSKLEVLFSKTELERLALEEQAIKTMAANKMNGFFAFIVNYLFLFLQITWYIIM